MADDDAVADPPLDPRRGNHDFLNAILDRNVNKIYDMIFEEVDIHLGNDVGNLPIHAAAFTNDAKIVEILVKAGSAVGARGNLGRTPLHVACMAATPSSSPAVVEFLLAHGADPLAEDETGRKPKDYLPPGSSIAKLFDNLILNDWERYLRENVLSSSSSVARTSPREKRGGEFEGKTHHQNTDKHHEEDAASASLLMALMTRDRDERESEEVKRGVSIAPLRSSSSLSPRAVGTTAVRSSPGKFSSSPTSISHRSEANSPSTNIHHENGRDDETTTTQVVESQDEKVDVEEEKGREDDVATTIDERFYVVIDGAKVFITPSRRNVRSVVHDDDDDETSTLDDDEMVTDTVKDNHDDGASTPTPSDANGILSSPANNRLPTVVVSFVANLVDLKRHEYRLGMLIKEGNRVSKVGRGSAARAGGILEGDVLLGIVGGGNDHDGEAEVNFFSNDYLDDLDAVIDALKSHAENRGAVSLRIRRVVPKVVTLAEFPWENEEEESMLAKIETFDQILEILNAGNGKRAEEDDDEASERFRHYTVSRDDYLMLLGEFQTAVSVLRKRFAAKSPLDDFARRAMASLGLDRFDDGDAFALEAKRVVDAALAELEREEEVENETIQELASDEEDDGEEEEEEGLEALKALMVSGGRG